jgi:hypothetical protein
MPYRLKFSHEDGVMVMISKAARGWSHGHDFQGSMRMESWSGFPRKHEDGVMVMISKAA